MTDLAHAVTPASEAYHHASSTRADEGSSTGGCAGGADINTSTAEPRYAMDTWTYQDFSERVKAIAPSLAHLPELTLEDTTRVQRCFLAVLGERDSIVSAMDLRVVLSELGFYPGEEELELLLRASHHKMTLAALCNHLRFYKKEFVTMDFALVDLPAGSEPGGRGGNTQSHLTGSNMYDGNAATAQPGFTCFASHAQRGNADTLRAFIALGGNEDGSGQIAATRLCEAVREFDLTIDMQALIASVDTERRGVLDYDDFCTLWGVAMSDESSHTNNNGTNDNPESRDMYHQAAGYALDSCSNSATHLFSALSANSPPGLTGMTGNDRPARYAANAPHSIHNVAPTRHTLTPYTMMTLQQQQHHPGSACSVSGNIVSVPLNAANTTTSAAATAAQARRFSTRAAAAMHTSPPRATMTTPNDMYMSNSNKNMTNNTRNKSNGQYFTAARKPSRVSISTYAAASSHYPTYGRHVSAGSSVTRTANEARHSCSIPAYNNNSGNNYANSPSNCGTLAQTLDGNSSATVQATPVTSEEHMQLLCIFLFPERYGEPIVPPGRHACIRLPDNRVGHNGNNNNNNSNNDTLFGSNRTHHQSSGNNHGTPAKNASLSVRSSAGARQMAAGRRQRSARGAAGESQKSGNANSNSNNPSSINGPSDGRAGMTLGGHIYQPPSPMMLSTRGTRGRRDVSGRPNGTW